MQPNLRLCVVTMKGLSGNVHVASLIYPSAHRSLRYPHSPLRLCRDDKVAEKALFQRCKITCKSREDSKTEGLKWTGMHTWGWKAGKLGSEWKDKELKQDLFIFYERERKRIFNIYFFVFGGHNIFVCLCGAEDRTWAACMPGKHATT
ncbi:hypothetical protein H1C71_013398 [Ictidomys tridecemlineatus]|nr:hypothetical protein H1C71_013398 [Ictidomys tridecemlineatus]KAG3292122.1 hypothetical protein H1C71_013398 [Ictidomys tridecemlineatus]